MDKLSQDMLLKLAGGFRTRKDLAKEIGASVDQVGRRGRYLASQGYIDRPSGMYKLSEKGRKGIKTGRDPIGQKPLHDIIKEHFPDIQPEITKEQFLPRYIFWFIAIWAEYTAWMLGRYGRLF